MVFKYFWKRLTVQEVIFGNNVDEDPAGVMVIDAALEVYPAPPSITFTDMICPFCKTGVKTAPIPPVTDKFGGEL